MKNIFLLITIVLFSSSLILGGGRKSISVLPKDGKPVTILLGEKEKEYYAVTHQSPLTFELDGPGKLMIVSRLLLPKNSPGSEKYSLRIMERKNTIKIHTTQTDPSDATIKGSDEVAGKSRKVSFDIPDGSFTYVVHLDDTPREAAVRLLFKPSARKRKLVSIEPLSYDRIVTALIKENIVAYYVASRERGVQLRVIGPTKVSVSARLNYDESMKGKQKFSLVVNEGQAKITQRAFETLKSEGILYQEWKEVVPGRPNSMTFEVPKGEHLYRIALAEGSAKSVSLRFSVPQTDLSNEK